MLAADGGIGAAARLGEMASQRGQKNCRHIPCLRGPSSTPVNERIHLNLSVGLTPFPGFHILADMRAEEFPPVLGSSEVIFEKWEAAVHADEAVAQRRNSRHILMKSMVS